MPEPTDRLTDIAAREQAATPGLWEAETLPPTELHKHPAYWVNTEYTDADGVTTHETVADCPWAEADAQFVAHARQDVPWLLAEVTRLRAALAKYVGKEPTIADEMAYLQRCLNAVYEVCDQAAAQATRWENPLPIPEWATTVRQAASGERPDNPADKRRRIYLDGTGNAWIVVGQDPEDGELLAQIDAACLPPEETAHDVRERTGELHEIGRCW